MTRIRVSGPGGWFEGEDERMPVGSDVENIVDGGIRRGTHIAKALALGSLPLEDG